MDPLRRSTIAIRSHRRHIDRARREVMHRSNFLQQSVPNSLLPVDRSEHGPQQHLRRVRQDSPRSFARPKRAMPGSNAEVDLTHANA
jgi:hypothetical protein